MIKQCLRINAIYAALDELFSDGKKRTTREVYDYLDSKSLIDHAATGMNETRNHLKGHRKSKRRLGEIQNMMVNFTEWNSETSGIQHYWKKNGELDTNEAVPFVRRCYGRAREMRVEADRQYEYHSGRLGAEFQRRFAFDDEE